MTSIQTLRAVQHPDRRRIIECLGLNGPCQVGTLAHELGMQVGSVSHHLRTLERVGVVSPAPELATDGRTSWWRLEQSAMSWSIDDFADSPADRLQATAAERVNIEHQLRRLNGWRAARDRDRPDAEAWRRAAGSVDNMTRATPAELARLMELVQETFSTWRDSIEPEDGQRREPVFFFAYGFPFQP